MSEAQIGITVQYMEQACFENTTPLDETIERTSGKQLASCHLCWWVLASLVINREPLAPRGLRWRFPPTSG